MIGCWKGIDEEINIGGSIKPSIILGVSDCEKTLFRSSKWPQKFGIRKIAKNSKLQKNYFELVGKGGWPPTSSWISLWCSP
jgi:hypothetical protein